MHIVTSGIPRYSTGEVNDSFMREIKRGFEIEKYFSGKRDMIAAKEAKELQGKQTKALGRCVMSMHPRDYFRIKHKYGHEEINSPEFIRYFQKKHPELSPNKL